MGKIYNGGYTAATGFKRTDNTPLDDSLVVQSIVDLINIEKPYKMMMVGVVDENKYYVLTGTPATVASSWTVLSGEGGGGGGWEDPSSFVQNFVNSFLTNDSGIPYLDDNYNTIMG